jgi:hypothetical protein
MTPVGHNGNDKVRPLSRQPWFGLSLLHFCGKISPKLCHPFVEMIRPHRHSTRILTLKYNGRSQVTFFKMFLAGLKRKGLATIAAIPDNHGFDCRVSKASTRAVGKR